MQRSGGPVGSVQPATDSGASTKSRQPGTIRFERIGLLFGLDDAIEVAENLFRVVDGVVDGAAAGDGPHRIHGSLVQVVLLGTCSILHESIQECFRLTTHSQAGNEVGIRSNVVESDHAFSLPNKPGEQM